MVVRLSFKSKSKDKLLDNIKDQIEDQSPQHILKRQNCIISMEVCT